MPLLTQEHLREIIAALEPAYPSEGCGLVLRNPEGQLRVHPCRNLADELHAREPERFPRTSRTFYAIDPREFMKADRRKDHVRFIFHSHCDLGDYFSEEDRLQATMGMGEEAGPAFPDCDYLVVSVMNGKAAQATVWSYSDETKRFEAAEVYPDLDKLTPT